MWNGHTQVVRLLIEKGANPTVANNNGQKPLQLAKNKELKAIIDSAVQGTLQFYSIKQERKE